MGDALFVHGGVTDAQEARLALAGLIAVHGATLLDVRTGVMHGAGSTALVTGTTATGPMTVSIAPHQWVTSRGTANGPYLGALAAAQSVTIGAAPGSGTRIDVVYVKQNDPTAGVPTPDTSPATAQPIYGVLAGTVGAGKPSLATIVGAEELATVSVSAGATKTTDGTVLITNTARQVVARGADIPCRTDAERDAITKFIGLAVKRLDDGGRVERWTGTAWAAPSDVPVLASIAARNTYFTGNLRPGASALVAGTQHVYDGTTWRFTLYGSGTYATSAAGVAQVAHATGQTPVAMGATIGPQSTEAKNQVASVQGYFSDATFGNFRINRTDSAATLGSDTVALDWWMKF